MIWIRQEKKTSQQMPAKIPKPTSFHGNSKAEKGSLEKSQVGSVENKTQKYVSEGKTRSNNVQEYLKNYLLAVKKTGCSSSTIRNYKSDINQFLDFLESNDINDLRNKPKLLAFAHYQRDKGLKENSIKRKLVSITQFKLWLKQEGLLSSEIPLSILGQAKTKAETLERKIIDNDNSKKQEEPKKEQTPEEKTQKKNKRPKNRLFIFLNLLALFLFLGGLAYFAYQQFGQAIISMAYPSTPTNPSRILSYQGRLTNTAQNPITTATNMTYELYDADSGGNLLWSSNTCSIDPDQDGIFNANLGAGSGTGSDNESCGAEIDENVFTENNNVWLEVTIASETLTPRQPIRTVAYAINSSTLQGLRPSETATNSTILMMNENGELVLGMENPTIKTATDSAGLVIESSKITMQTTSASNGDVVLSPDGTGIVDIQGSASVSGTTTLIGNTYITSPNTLIFNGSTALGEITSPTDSGAYLIGVYDEFDNSTSTNVQGVLNDLDAAISGGGGSSAWSSLTAPTGNLSLSHSTYTTAFNWATGTGTDNLFSLTSDASANGTGSLLNVQTGASSTLSPLRIRAGSTEALSVDSSGKVGIGTTSPYYNLHVSSSDGVMVSNTDFVAGSAGSGLGIKTMATSGNVASGIQAFTTGGTTMGILSLNPYGGNVGIGTTSPSNKLHVEGTDGGSAGIYLNHAVPSITTNTLYSARGALYWNGAVLNTGSSSISGTTNYIPKFTSSNSIGDSILYEGSGNIGIGITNPQELLHLYSTSDYYPTFEGTTNEVGFGLTNSQASWFMYIDDSSNNNADAGSLIFHQDSASARMVIDGDGNLGIGTTSPTYKLDVAGDINLTGALRDNGGAGTSGQILSSTGTGVEWVDTSSVSVGDASTLDSLDSLQFLRSDTDDEFSSGTLSINSAATLDINGSLIANGSALFQNTSDSITALQINDAAGNSIFNVDTSNKRVGIGTVSPTHELTIKGSASESTFGSNLLSNGDFASGDFTSWTAGANWAVVSNAAQHTAGSTATLTQSISLTNGTQYQVDLTQSGATAGSFYVDVGSELSEIVSIIDSSKSFTFTSGSTGAVNFTITPSSDYDGSIDNLVVRSITGGSSADFALLNDDDSLGWEARSGGSGLHNIFIGTNAGSNNTTGTNSNALGYEALKNNTSGQYNDALGAFSLHSNTYGSSNSAFGYSSLYSNVSGSANNAFGSLSLYSNSSGSSNSAFGYSSLYSNTDGYFNNAFGNYALYSNTTGEANVAFGNNTLYTNTNGSYNTAVGYGVLYNNISGDRNSALGLYALYNNTTGEYNTALGTETMYSNTEGHNNVAIGFQSLYANQTGNYNVAIGRSTMFNNTADYNIAIGYYSMYANTSGVHNVGIGYRTLRYNSTGSYNIALGYGALQDNTASYNTAVGDYSLYNNTSGAYNSSFGKNSLYTNTTSSRNNAFGYNSLYYSNGYDNSAFGHNSLSMNSSGWEGSAFGNYSLASNTTGFRNSAFGYEALLYNTTGSSNTAFGRGALDENTTGSFNIAIGDKAGALTSTLYGLTDAENSIYIGAGAMGYNNDDNNSIVIGYGAAGIGANTVVLGNNSIVTTALKGKVGIGTTNPYYNLHVSSSDGVMVSNTDFAAGSAGSGLGIKTMATSGNVASGIQSFNTGGTTMGILSLNPYGGFVGVNTSSPAQELHVYSATDNADVRIQGSASASYMDVFSGGASYGLWGVGAIPLVFSTDNTERMRIDSSGNVGIGTSSPYAPLHVYTSSDVWAAYFGSNSRYLTIAGTAGGDSASAFGLIQQTGGTGNLSLQGQGGNVGIGTAAPGQLLELYKNDADVAIRFHEPGNAHYAAGIDYSDDRKFKINYGSYPGEQTSFVMDSSGNVGIGIAPGSTFDVNGNIRARLGAAIYAYSSDETRYGRFLTNAFGLHIDSMGGGNTYINWFGGSTTFIGNGSSTYGVIRASAFTVSSSLRYKENIEPSSYSLADVLKLNPVTYNYNYDPDKVQQLGLIAEEVDTIFPEAVTYNDNGQPEALDYSKFTPLLIIGMKEQQEIIKHIDISDNDFLTIINGDIVNNYSLIYNDGTGNKSINAIAGFAKATIAELKAGVVRTTDLIADNITVAGQSLQEYVQDLIDSSLEEKLTLNSNKLDQLAIQNSSDQTVASIDGDGNAQLSGNLEVAGGSKLGSLIAEEATFSSLTSNSASVSGTLFTTEIEAGSARLDYIESQLANIERINAKQAQLDEATVSGTLRSDRIETNSISANIIEGLQERLSAEIAATLQEPSLLAILLGEDQTENNEQYLEETATLLGANLDDTPTTIDSETEEIILLADSVLINNYFEVNGNALISQSLAVGNNLSVANGLSLGDGYLAYQPVGFDQDDADFVFSIQPSGRGRLSLMAGLLSLDEKGLITINGDLHVAGAMEINGDLKAKGTLLTNLIKADNPEENINIQLAQLEASNSAVVRKSNLQLLDENNQPVASFSADGNLALKGTLSIDQAEATNAADLNKSAGRATLVAGQTELIISTTTVKENSMVYITPLASTNNQVLYVTNKIIDNPQTPENEGQFSVKLDFALEEDVDFNWWLIN